MIAARSAPATSAGPAQVGPGANVVPHTLPAAAHRSCLVKLEWCHCRLVHASLTPRRGGAWYAAASTDVDAALSAVPVVDQNGFIVTPGGSGPGVPAASWHHDYTKEAQRLKKWRAMLGAPAGARARLGARRPGCRARQGGAPCCARLPGPGAALACATIILRSRLHSAWQLEEGGAAGR